MAAPSLAARVRTTGADSTLVIIQNGSWRRWMRGLRLGPCLVDAWNYPQACTAPPAWLRIHILLRLLSYIQEDISRTSACLSTARYCSSCLIGDAATIVLFIFQKQKFWEKQRMVLVRFYPKEYGGRLCLLESAHPHIVHQEGPQRFYYCSSYVGSNGVCRCIAVFLVKRVARVVPSLPRLMMDSG
jgi:hypothetical protein